MLNKPNGSRVELARYKVVCELPKAKNYFFGGRV